MSEAVAVGYAFEELAPSEPPARDAPARMLAQASAEAEQLRESARGEGYREGHEAGRADAAAQLSRAVEALGQALSDVTLLRDELAQALERDAVELAIELARKIAAGGASQAPAEPVLEAVRGALRRLGERRRIVVLLNPEDFDVVAACIEDLTRAGSGVELCELLCDERVQPGGAIVRTDEGEVDASVATQLERAREVVEASLQGVESPA